MKTDDICKRYSGRKVDLTVRLLDGEDPHVLLEGPADALKMLAELLAAVAEERANDGFGLSPSSAGNAHFSSAATHGVYIHRLDAPAAK